jgi:hypothetical protein
MPWFEGDLNKLLAMIPNYGDVSEVAKMFYECLPFLFITSRKVLVLLGAKDTC